MAETNWNNKVLHIDINSYFAAILQQENPHLRNKPVGVVKDVGRTCIIAASKEAKKLGVITGSNAYQAKIKAPDIILVPAQFSRYLDATKRLKKIFSTISPHIYIYSLDEAFINISDCQKYLYPDLDQLAIMIQKEIQKELGDWVTTNVGISSNYFLAKIASNIALKGTHLTIDQDNLDPILAEVSFSDVCGVGSRLAKKLLRLGVINPYQIRFYSREELENFFGPFWSRELLKIAWGEETNHLASLDKPATQMKSVSRSITGYHLYDDEKEIKAIIYNLTSEVIHKVRKMGLAGRNISISLSGKDQSWSEHITVKHHINHETEMFDLIYNKLYKNWKRPFKIIKFGVRMSLLSKMGQDSLLPSWKKKEQVHQALDKINTRYGLFTVRSGALLNQPIIQPEVTGFFGDRIYQLDD